MLCNSGTKSFCGTPYISRGLPSKSFRLIYKSPGSDNVAKSYRRGRTDRQTDGQKRPSFLNNIDSNIAIILYMISLIFDPF